MQRKTTERQDAAILKARKNGGCALISPDLAKQLVKRGLAELTGKKYQRWEWQRPVVGSTLWEIRLKGS